MIFPLSKKKSVLIILILLSIIYFQSNFYQLIFLDDDTIVYNKFADMSIDQKISSSFTSNFLSGHYYRPITSLTFVVDSILGEQSYLIYHFTNFLIHLFTSILIFLIIENLGYSIITSLIAALLFALNPIHINAVGWIAGRGDLLAAFFSTTALLIFLKFIKQNKPILLLSVSTLLFLALLSKEVSLLVPFLFLVLYFIEKKELSLDKSSIGVLLMIVIVFGTYYLLRAVFLSGVHIDKFSFTTYYKNILVLPETISKFFIPLGIKALPSTEIFTSVSGIIIFILLLILPLKLNAINRLRYYFGMIWFIILLLPGMVFRTMEQDGFYYWDCRSYLPLIGLLFILAEIFKVVNLQKYRKRHFTIIIIYILVLGTITFIKIRMYENPITYWSSVKEDYPTRFLPYIGLYNYFNHIKDFNNAEYQLIEAIKLSPNEFSIRQLLINFYLANSQENKAFDLLKDTIYKRMPGSVNLLEKFILLSYELKKSEAINDLTIIYKDNAEVLKQVNKIKSKQNL